MICQPIFLVILISIRVSLLTSRATYLLGYPMNPTKMEFVFLQGCLTFRVLLAPPPTQFSMLGIWESSFFVFLSLHTVIWYGLQILSRISQHFSFSPSQTTGVLPGPGPHPHVDAAGSPDGAPASGLGLLKLHSHWRDSPKMQIWTVTSLPEHHQRLSPFLSSPLPVCFWRQLVPSCPEDLDGAPDLLLCAFFLILSFAPGLLVTGK